MTTAPVASNFSRPHLLDIASFSRDDITQLLALARRFLDTDRQGNAQIATMASPLAGRIVASLFLETSTRTQMSFEFAAKRLGAEVITLHIPNSSMEKGESFQDTAHMLNAMGPDILVVRHSANKMPHALAQDLSCAVVNAGDGAHEHPSQALLDALTLEEHVGALDKLRVAICGDLRHSRVAHSNTLLLEKMGAQVHLIAPKALWPKHTYTKAVRKFTQLKSGLAGCDIVMALRLQSERNAMAALMQNTDSQEIKSEAAILRNYYRDYGIRKASLAWAKAGVKVMHPGPMNRGKEIASDIADNPDISLIRTQVTMGVAMRMAILHALACYRLSDI